MSITTLCQALPDYAEDISTTLSVLMDETVLTEQQKWGCCLVSAYAVGSATVIRALEDGCPLSEQAQISAKSAASVMAMNTVYYRAMNLMQSREYATLPAKLGMSVLANPGVDKADFELWCMAVSAIKGCGVCLDSHEQELRKHGAASQAIQASVRIAAVIDAASRILIAEEASHA